MSGISYEGSLKMNMNDYRGLSAYEIAVENGFEGTEQEWLASLKGEPGKDADTITVNRKRAVDGNISVNATDIQLRAGEARTVAQELTALGEKQTEGVKYTDIVNDLTSGGEKKVLSAEMGAKLERTKAQVFGVVIEIPATGWSGDGPYTREVSAPGVDENSDSCLVDVAPHPEHYAEWDDCELKPVAQGLDKLTFTAEEIPETAFPVNVKVTLVHAESEASEE